MPDYSHLLSPGRLGKLELRNRIVMAPMGSNFAEETTVASASRPTTKPGPPVAPAC